MKQNKKMDYYIHEPAGKRKMRIIKEVLGKEGGNPLHILDVGCGDGHLSAYMASLGNNVLGIDIDKKAASAAQKRYGKGAGKFVCQSIKEVSGKYDVISAFEVCEHIDDLPSFLKDVRSRLKPGGLFLISVPNGWSLEEMIRRFVQHTRVGGYIKKFLRSLNVLPKSDAQSHADSPHIHFWQYAKWKREIEVGDFVCEGTWNVSLFFKQLYYIGLRRFLHPKHSIFITLDKIDGKLVHRIPRMLSDGWMMTFRIK